MENSVRVIELDDNKLLIKRYKIRPTGKEGATLETSIPKEVFEREARKLGFTFEGAVEKLVAVWRYNEFHGLHLSFEPASEVVKDEATET